MDALQSLYESAVEDFPRDSAIKEVVKEHLRERNKETELFMDAVILPDTGDNEVFFKHLRRLHTTLSTRDPLLNVPKGLEARRRISFFSNSLFMTMPRAPQVLFNTVLSYYAVTLPSSAIVLVGDREKEINEYV